MNCINLPEFRVIKAEENEFDYRFTVETIEEPDFCPQCFYTTDSPRYDGKPFIKHGIKDREVWDLDMHATFKRVKRYKEKLRKEAAIKVLLKANGKEDKSV